MPIFRSVRYFARRCLPVAVAVLTPLAWVPTARPQGLNTIAVELETLPSSYSTLAAALRAAGLNTALAGPGPFTVFAPSNLAFGQLLPGTVETWLQPAKRDPPYPLGRAAAGGAGGIRWQHPGQRGQREPGGYSRLERGDSRH